QTPHPDRFLTFTEPWWERSNQPGYSQFQADEIARAHKAGARGLKVLKTLGLYLRENISTGPLVKVDDKRFDAMWEVCGSLGIPVAIHVSDPEAFFLPIDRFNERFEELNNHPDWSFHGGDFPSNAELLEARNRVLARHPKTQFIVLHVGNDAENLPYVSECMDRFPNMHVELGARIGELGRQPRMARKFFDKYQDRILFGTDAVPNGTGTPQQVFTDRLYDKQTYEMTLFFLRFLMVALLLTTGENHRPGNFRVIGPGGSGAMFHPTASPHDLDTVLVGCDMTGTYITHDGGKSWRMFNL